MRELPWGQGLFRWMRWLTLACLLAGVTAQVYAVNYAITMTVNPLGSGTASCTPIPVNSGGSSTCTVTPNVGYTFTNWSGDCTGATCTLSNVLADKNVTSNFTISTNTITSVVSPSGSGTVSCTPNPVNYGSSGTCTATPNAGYTFSNWTGDCTGSSCTLSNVQAAKAVTANFTLNTYTITTAGSPSGSGTVSCSPNPVGYGTNSTCTATPSAGFMFVSWSGDCSGTNCNLSNVQSSKSVTATFTFIATLTATGNLTLARTNHTSTLLTSGKVLVAGGYNNTDGVLATAELFDPTTGTWSGAGSLTLARYSHTATMLPSGKVLVVGGTNGSGSIASASLYDSNTNTWSAAGSLSVARSAHTATLLPSGQVLVVGGYGISGYLDSSETYAPETNTWAATGSLLIGRQAHAANLLPSGKVLVAGGLANNGATASVELYDPETHTSTAAAPLAVSRQSHTATLLPSGKVLVVGGLGISGSLATSELYDTVTNLWSSVGGLIVARSGHVAVLQPSGMVMVTGGANANGVIRETELYDPTANAWMAIASLSTARQGHTATLLTSGQTLVSGGVGNLGPSAGAELYDPALIGVTTAGSLSIDRISHAATLLPNGKVLVSGGGSASAELYDPTTNGWSAAANMTERRDSHTMTLLNSGKVLVIGGTSPGKKLVSAEMYDPVSNLWTLVASMAAARSGHTATLLQSGKVLVVGGLSGETVSTVEIYDPVTNTWSLASNWSAAVEHHRAVLLPDGRVLTMGAIPSVSALYDPASDSWGAVPSTGAQYLSVAVELLPSGKVLALGGSYPGYWPGFVGLYDSNLNTWSLSQATPPDTTSVLALLPSGQVLVIGGSKYTYWGTYAGSVSVYDPTANTLTVVDGTGRTSTGHTATLLPSGKVLVIWGDGKDATLYSYDRSSDTRRPILNAASNPMLLGSLPQLILTGTGFDGDSEASGGSVNSSATNYPLVQLRRLDNNQITWLSPSPVRSPTTYTSTPLTGLTPAPYAVTMFVNGIASQSQIVRLVSNWTVKPSSNGNGSISPNSDQAVSDGATSTFTLTPNTGYILASVGGTCGGNLSGNTYTTNAVTTDCTVIATFAALSVHLINISTRGQVQTGDNVMIGGFIIGGSTPKTVLITARGPSLTAYGVPGVLANPVLNLYSGQTVIFTNDNWGDAPNVSAIQTTGVAPGDALESAILTTLSPGPYTAIVSGASGSTGVGMVEVFEVDNANAPLINISTRGRVLTGDSVLIGGFIIQGNSPQTVLIRAAGPNLANHGVPNVLADPVLQLFSGQTVIASNDNWVDAANASAIQATGTAPVYPLESAILITLDPGPYTAIMSGANGSTGVGIVEVVAQ